MLIANRPMAGVVTLLHTAEPVVRVDALLRARVRVPLRSQFLVALQARLKVEEDLPRRMVHVGQLMETQYVVIGNKVLVALCMGVSKNFEYWRHAIDDYSLREYHSALR